MLNIEVKEKKKKKGVCASDEEPQTQAVCWASCSSAPSFGLHRG